MTESMAGPGHLEAAGLPRLVPQLQGLRSMNSTWQVGLCEHVDAAWLFKTQLQKSPGATSYAPRLKGGQDMNLTSELEGCQTVVPLLTLGWGRGRSFLL